MSIATAVIVIESNLPLVAESVKRAIDTRGVARCVVMSEDRKRGRSGTGGGGGGEAEVRAGTRTTRENKPQMVAALREALAARAVRMHSQFVVAQPEAQPPDEAHPRDNIVTELENFKQEIRFRNVSKANAPYVRETIAYSGRHTGGGRARDDYVMALCFLMLMHAVFAVAPEYRTYR